MLWIVSRCYLSKVQYSLISGIESHHILDDIRFRFVASGGIEEIVETLWDSDSEVRTSALDCLRRICVQGIISYVLKSSNSYYL